MQIRKVNQFNAVIVGTGGQGLITLLQIIAEAALLEGYEVRTSELHGLAQRGGSVEVHVRFGRQIHSPLVVQNKADLVIALEMQEALRASYFANPKTTFLIARYVIPIPLQQPLSEKQVLKALKTFTKKIKVVPATEICQEELGTSVVAGIYLISLASFKNLIPLKPDSLLRAIKKVIPRQYLELNKKAFDLAKEHAKG
jgi:indolepyruvate ferredoxin oxidoreductase beta subunit